MPVQRLFRSLEEQGVILRNPALDLPLPHWKKLPRALLNQAQSRRLVSAPDAFTVRGKRDRAILELLYGTAIRVGECERLDLRDLDLAREQLFIRDGKGRKDRVVPLMGRAAAAVDAGLRESRPELQHDPKESALFLTARGQRVSVKRIQDLVRSHAKAAGLDLRVTPYTLRHGCATHLLQNGAGVHHVQKLLGHARVQTTAIYTKVTTTDLARVVAKAHPGEAHGIAYSFTLWKTCGTVPWLWQRRRIMIKPATCGLVGAAVSGGLSSIVLASWPQPLNWVALPDEKRTNLLKAWYQVEPILGFVLAFVLPALLGWILVRPWATGRMRSWTVAVPAIVTLNALSPAAAYFVSLVGGWELTTTGLVTARLLTVFAGIVTLTSHGRVSNLGSASGPGGQTPAL